MIRGTATSLRCRAPLVRLITTRSKSSRVDPSFVGTASEYFTNLRWKAATVLTESLDTKEKEKLLKKLDVQPEEKPNEEEDTKSVLEAVAAARAEESQRFEAKWNRDREKLMKEAEEAAKARIESDLRIQERRIALEQWERELEKEKKLENEALNGIAQPVADVHPVLGKALADLGSKRLHIVSAKELANIPIWKKQRIYRHSRATAMAKDKVKTAEMGLPGVIALHEDEDGKLSILDGQHRVGMMTILEQKETDIDLDQILVEVFPHHSKFSAEDIFLEINKAEPVKLVDMPGVASQSDRKVITQVAASLEEQFPEMFKSSQRCRAPHVNVDNLRDAIFASDILKRHSVKSRKALLTWVLAQNDLLKEKFEKEGAAGVSAAALDKAKKNNFFLGLDPSWLYK